MRLLAAARIVKKLGIASDLRRLVGRFHVQEPRSTVARSISLRVGRAFGTHKNLGPDAVKCGHQLCREACVTYAVAVHRRNLRTYGRVVEGTI